MGDLLEFRAGDVVEGFTPQLQLLVEFDRFLLHQGMGVLRSPVKAEIISPGDPAMPVPAVKSQSEKK